MIKYKLKGFSSITYCMNDTQKQPYGIMINHSNLIHKTSEAFVFTLDFLDIFAAIFIVTLLILMIVSSLIDRFLRNLHGPDAQTFYRCQPDRKLYQVLTLFSIRRNWYNLSKPTNAEYRDLRFIQAIRAVTTWFVIFGHVCYCSEFLPAINPQSIEGVSDQRWSKS